MSNSQEALVEQIQLLMKQFGQDNIKIGNFVIRREQSPIPSVEEKPRQKRNNTALVSQSHWDSSLSPALVSKSEQNIDNLDQRDSIQEKPTPHETAPPNDFVQNIFHDLSEFSGLDQFIELPNMHQSRQDSASHKSATIESASQKGVQRKLLNRFYQVIDKQNLDPFVQNQLESALQYDFEQILKPLSESSNTHLSYDTLTTITDTASSDPLRHFLMSLLPTKQQTIQAQKSQIDFLFLYSQPLAQASLNGTKKILQKLDIQKEMDGIISVFIEEQAALRFMAIPARMDLFGESLDLGPVALHYSGHGIYMEQNQQSYLLFESNQGMAQLVSANQIHLTLQKLKRPILFVFVASCHSRLIGEVFHQAGAEHVVCVHTKEQVMDEACAAFARAFYHSLIRGQQSVCAAFKSAKNQIRAEGRFPFAEENKFLLLTPNSHNNCGYWIIREGPFINLTHQSRFRQTLPSPVAHFVGRSSLMQELVERVRTNHLVQLKGVLGIGKSALLRELSIYIAERQLFKDGVLYLQMNQCDSFDSITSRLSQVLMPNAPFHSKQEMKQLVVTQLVQCMKPMDMLLVFDNCDLLYNSGDRDVFLDFLELVLSNCKTHLCLSNRVEALNNGRVIKVEGLAPEDSAQLLLNTSQRQISIEEVNDFLNCNDATKPTIHRIAAHPLFSILDGHPLGIILSAGLLDTYTLRELHIQLNNKQIIDFPIMSRISEEEKRSLKVSLNLIWTNLVDRYEKAAIFFGMMGLLPCGIFNDELEWVWGSGWEKLASQLLKSSLLIITKKENRTHYTLYNFIHKFAQSKLDPKNYKVYHLNIISLLVKRTQHFYQTIGTQNGDQSQPIEEFQNIELNIKNALFREFEEISEGEWDFEPARGKRKNSDSETKRKGIKQRLFEEDDTDSFALPLTKENLEMMQKRYETANSAKSQFSSKINVTSSMMSSFKFDQASDEPRQSTATDKPRTRKSLTSRPMHLTISEEEEFSKQNESENSDDVPCVESKVFNKAIIENLNQLEPTDIIAIPQNEQANNVYQSEQPNLQDLKPDVKFLKSSPNPNLKNVSELKEAKSNSRTTEMKRLKFVEEQRDEDHKQLNKKQKIPKLVVPRAKSGKAKDEPQTNNKRNYDDVKREKVQKLLLNYCNILLLCRRYNESLKFINWGYQYMYQDNIFVANLHKIKGCVYYLQKEESKAQASFKQAKDLFMKRGCTLGVASSEAAMGYIYFLKRDLQQAKIYFENALSLYENLNHDFGKHFLNRWLSIVKNKISSLKNDRAKHIKEEKQLIENLKQELKKGSKVDNLFVKKHKGGLFILRWLGDTMSIFMEQALIEDSKHKEILAQLKRVDENQFKKKRSKKETEGNSKSIIDKQPALEKVVSTKPRLGVATQQMQKITKKLQAVQSLDKKLLEIQEEKNDVEDQQQQKQNVPSKKEVKMRAQVMPCFKKKQ